MKPLSQDELTLIGVGLFMFFIAVGFILSTVE